MLDGGGKVFYTVIYADRSAVQLSTSFSHTLRVLRDLTLDLVILCASHLIAMSMRQQLPFGKYVGENYDWTSAQPYLICLISLAVAYVPRLVWEHPDPGLSVWRLYSPLLGVLLSIAGITFLLPHQSGLESFYFAVLALLLTLLVDPPATTAGNAGSLTLHLQRLWANRSLLRIWVQYNVQSRYAQAVLGVLWIVLLPLSQALIMTLVFSSLLRFSAGNIPFITFFLSALVPWGLFNQSIAAGMRSILNAMGLITQINFPREIIVLSALGEALVDTLFMFVAMLGINAFLGVWPNENYIWLLPLLAIQLAMTTGLMCLVSWLSVLIRDVPQLMSVVLQVLFYLCPVIYPASIVPARYHFILVLNPLATLIEAYRGIIVYNRPPDVTTLVYPAALGIGLLIFGYRLFKANEDTFADMV